MPKVYTNGEELNLRPDPSMPPGREGSVFFDPRDSAFLIKLIHAPDDQWREKLRLMLANPLATPDVAWPTEAVYARDRTTIVGCRVPFAAHKFPIPAVYATDPATRWLQADYGFRLNVAINFVAAVERVHQHGCVVGDLSPANTLVGKDATVCLIDTDSFQITRNGTTYRCNVGTPDYTAAELHGPKFCDVDRTVYHDAFGLAEFVFELLVGPGSHPFAACYTGKGSPLSLPERIRLGIWPYAKKRHRDYAPRTVAPFQLLHPLLQPLACRCFDANPKCPAPRPLPDEWLLALNEVKKDTDFVRVVAPHLEAEAQSRHRQTILAAAAIQTGTPPTPSSFAQQYAKPRRHFRRKVLVSIAASVLFVSTGLSLYFALPRAPQIDFANKTNHLLPTPAVYSTLSADTQIPPLRPRTQDPPLPTPALYDHLSRPYRD